MTNDALLRTVDELLWSIRREGVRIATSQAIDCLRALEIVGLEDRTTVLEAISSVVCKSARDRDVVREVFDAYFSSPRPAPFADFSEDEMRVLRDLVGEMISARGSDLDRVLSNVEVPNPLQAGMHVHRVLEQHALSQSSLAAIRLALRDALGERGDRLADALERERGAIEREIRAHVRKTRAEEPVRTLDRKALVTLDPHEIDEVRRAVRSFAARLRGRERARAHRRGKIDPHRVLRRALRTGGVPFELPRKRRHKGKPRLVLLCDISDSVRSVAMFLLEFVYVAHELFDKTRSFVFVSDVGESTRAFETMRVNEALPYVFGGGIVPVTSNSNYGRVLRAFADRAELDKRTTVVILGDGRTNYAPDGLDALEEIHARAKSVLWLCPEPRDAWGAGDSAMHRYATAASETLVVSTARELETAARRIVARR